MLANGCVNLHNKCQLGTYTCVSIFPSAFETFEVYLPNFVFFSFRLLLLFFYCSLPPCLSTPCLYMMMYGACHYLSVSW